MKFTALVIAALSIFGLTAAEEQGRSSRSGRSGLFTSEVPEVAAACSKELEGIVYQPHSAALSYFTRISEEIKVSGPVLWTPQNVSFIQTFENKYQVEVQVYDAFLNMIYPTDGSSNPMGFMPITSAANMNGSGFLRDTDSDEMARYQFIVFDCIGQMKYILLNMPLADAPTYKN